MTFRSILLGVRTPIAGLVQQLEDNADLWGKYDVRKMMGINKPHYGMDDIWVRYNAFSKFNSANPAAFNDEHVPVNYPAWYKLTELHEIIFGLMQRVNGEMLGGVLITKIPPGGKILPHVDTGWHVNYYKKFYLSLKSAPGAVFSFQDEGAPDSTREDVRPNPGDIWFIDNRRRHWVDNNSNEDRITVIICIRTEQPRFGGKDA